MASLSKDNSVKDNFLWDQSSRYKETSLYAVQRAAREGYLSPGASFQLQAVQVIQAVCSCIAAKQPQPPPIFTGAQAGSHACTGRLHTVGTKDV